MPRDYRERDMDEPLVVRGLLQWLCMATFFLARYALDVLLTPVVVDDAVFGVGRWARALTGTAWPVLRTCYAPLAPVLMLQLWKLATLDTLQWVFACACSFRLLVHVLMHDSLVVGSLTKRDIWPQIVPLATFVRVSGGRARRVPRQWRQGPLHLICGAVPWAIRLTILVLLLRRSAIPRSMLPHWPAQPGAADIEKWATDAEPWTEHDDLVARIQRCYDGDTCYAAELTWRGSHLPPLFGHNMKVRLLGVDTPELRGACPLEKCLALRAKNVLEDFVASSPEHRLAGCVRVRWRRGCRAAETTSSAR